MKNSLKTQLPSPAESRGSEDGQSSSRRGWRSACLAQKETSRRSTHVLNFQGQPGSRSLLEAVAWPPGSQDDGTSYAVGMSEGGKLKLMPQRDLKRILSVLCLPQLAHITL